MAKIIDLTKTDGDLVILGKSLVLPNSSEDSQPTPINGSIRFNPTVGAVQVFNAGAWENLGSDGGSGENGGTVTIAQILGLQSALNSKAAVVHGHAISAITGLQAALDNKTSIGHNHGIADITSLTQTLAAKSAVGHGHTFEVKETISVCFPDSPPTNFEVIWTAALTTYFDQNFFGSFGKVEINPTASYVVTIKQNATPVGSITVDPTGAITFASTVAFSVAPGDTLTFVAPARDATLRTLSFTLVGNRNQIQSSADVQLPPDIELIPGPPGPVGPPGVGVATGGLTGQVLLKMSDADGDTGWGPLPGQTVNPSFFFVESPDPSATVFLWTAPTDFIFSDEFAGSVGSIDTTPDQPYVLAARLNGTLIGTITISPTGIFTFATENGAVAVHQGDVLRVVAPPTGTCNGVAVTLNGLISDIGSVNSLNTLALSSNSVNENSPEGTEVATVFNRTAGSTLELVNDAAGRFSLVGNKLYVGATPLDYEAATFHNVTIRESLSGYTTRNTSFTINVNNVLELVLGSMSLATPTLVEATAPGTIISDFIGRTTGSVITLADDAGGRFAVSGGKLVTGATATDFETATTHQITIRELHPDAQNSPRDTVVTVSVTNALEVTLQTLGLTSSIITENAISGVVVGNVTNKSAGSTLQLIDNAGGRFALQGNTIVTGSVPTDYETATSHQITIREIHLDATNTPKDSVIIISVANALETTLGAITLTGTSIVENSPAGTIVGSLSGKSAGSTLTLLNNAGGRFTISGNNIVAGSVPTDYETATSHSITVRETHPDAGNSPRDTNFTVTVSNVLEVSLANLILSPATVTEGTAAGLTVGSIINKTSGSTLTLLDSAGNRFTLSGTTILTGSVATDYETATSHQITIRETHPDAATHDTTITINVNNISEVTLNALTLAASTLTEGSAVGTVVGAIQGGSAGSTITIVNDAGGRFAISGGNLVAGTTLTDYETATSHQITLRETHPDGANSPRDTNLTITITNVLEVTLPALTTNTTHVAENVTAGTIIASITNKTLGSTITLTDDASGHFALNGSGQIVAGATAFDSVATPTLDITLREGHPDATAPGYRDTTITFTVDAAGNL